MLIIVRQLYLEHSFNVAILRSQFFYHRNRVENKMFNFAHLCYIEHSLKKI